MMLALSSAVQVRWRSQDLEILETHPLTPGLDLNPSLNVSIHGAQSGDLNSGGLIGVSVAVTTVVVLSLVAIALLVKKRRKRRAGGEEMGQPHRRMPSKTSPASAQAVSGAIDEADGIEFLPPPPELDGRLRPQTRLNQPNSVTSSSPPTPNGMEVVEELTGGTARPSEPAPTLSNLDNRTLETSYRVLDSRIAGLRKIDELLRQRDHVRAEMAARGAARTASSEFPRELSG